MIGKFDPTELATHVSVIERRQPVRVIQAARYHIDLIWEVYILEGQLCAALRTETPRALRSGAKLSRLTTNEPELRARHAEPRDERSFARSTADRAMAVCFMKRSAQRLVTNSATKTST